MDFEDEARSFRGIALKTIIFSQGNEKVIIWV